MKLVSFTAAGRNSYGVMVGDGIVDLGRRLGDRYPTLRTAIAGDALGRAAADAKSATPDVALSQVTLLPPITDPDKIICAGRNYRAHAAEAGGAPPENPQVFLRLVNTLVAHNQPMVCPKISGDFDYEGELALVIGKPGRHIAKADALSHVFGYTLFNDGSIRDIQFKHSIAAGKNFHATGGFGPWIVTADEIPDPTRLHLVTRLNRQQVQHTGIDDLIFDIPTLISYCSDWTPLVAGDVISTGTPEGVGFARRPPLWMKPGDVVEVEIGEIGTFRAETRSLRFLSRPVSCATTFSAILQGHPRSDDADFARSPRRRPHPPADPRSAAARRGRPRAPAARKRRGHRQALAEAVSIPCQMGKLREKSALSPHQRGNINYINYL